MADFFNLSAFEFSFFPGRVSSAELNAAAQQAAAQAAQAAAQQAALQAAQQAALEAAQQAAIQAAMQAAQQLAQQEAQKAAAQQAAAQQAAQQASSNNGTNLSKESVYNFNGDPNNDVAPLYFSDLKDGVFKLRAEIVADYEVTSKAVHEALEQAIANPLEGIPTEDVITAKNHLDKAKNYFDKTKSINETAGYLDSLKDGIELLTDLNQNRSLTNWHEYEKAIGTFDKNLDNYLNNHYKYRDLPLFKNLKENQLNQYRPLPSEYTDHYTKTSIVNEIRKSDTSFVNKVNMIGDIIDKDTSFNLKNTWRNASKLEKAGVIMSIANVGINVVDSWNEIGNALNDASKADLLGKWHAFNESFKAQNSEKYDNFNLSVIDAVGTGVGVIVGTAATAALVTAGAPVVAAGLIVTGTVALGTATAKTIYSTSQHKDASFWKTLGKNLNPLDPFFDKSGSTYAPKKSVALKSGLKLLAAVNVTTIIGGNANDTLVNNSRNSVIILGYADNDFIFNQSSENVTISGGEGNDSITNVDSSNVTISGDGGSDLISNWASKVEIFGGDGNNTIRNFDSKEVLMTALDGDNYIDNAGDSNSIVAGNGNNTVDNIGAGVEIQTGGGSNLINNIGVQSKIYTGAGNDYITTEGDNITVSAGSGNDSLENTNGSQGSIDMGAGDDFVESFGDLNTINADDGADIVNNVGNENSVYAGLGDDYIENIGQSNTIIGAAGEDYILNVGDNNLVDAGTDHDYIVNLGNNNTIIGGAGNDIIDLQYGTDNLIRYTGGNDYIYGFNETSILQIGDGTGEYSTQVSGEDLIVITCDGKITLENAASLFAVNSEGVYNDPLFIKLSAGNDFYHNESILSATIAGLGGNDTIENRISEVSINGGSGDNRFVNDGIAVTMISGDGADTIANAGDESLIDAGNGNNSIGNAGNTVSILAGSGSDSILNEGSNVTMSVAGGTNQITNKGSENSIIVGSGNNTIQNYGEATNIEGGPHSDIIMPYSNVILNGATNTTITGGSGTNTIINYFAAQVDDNENITKVLYNGNNVLINGGANSDSIENYGPFGTINGGNGDDTIKNFGFLLIDEDRKIIRRASITNYYYKINAGAGDNLVYNENASATITSGMGKDLIENIADTVSINAGDGANTIANIGNTVTIQSGAGNDSIETDGANVTISAGAGNDFIHNYSNGSKSSLNGGDGGDTIENDAQNVIIDAGIGNDHIANAGSDTTIHAGRGDDTIVLDASAQNNVIKYRAGDGNKIIYGCNSTTTIKISGADFNTTGNVSDKIIKVGESTITLKNAANVSGLNIIREDETDPEIITGTEKADSINNSLSSAAIFGLGGADSITNSGANVLIDGGDGGDYIDSIGKNVTIKGGEGADIIHNRGWGSTASIDAGAGDDTIDNNGANSTIDGNLGDDYISNWGDNSTLRGGAGDDTIINNGYGSGGFLDGGKGNDLIGNGTDGKMSYGTFSNVTVDAGEGDDTIRNNGVNVSINAGTGNDDIANYIYYGVTINAGADNDTVTNSGASVSVDAGDGDDYISNSGSSVTIKGGKGNDTLDAVGSETILFGTDDGSDVINNWQNKNSISLTSGKILTTLLSGEDIILGLGSDSLTLKNAKYKLVRIDNADGTQTILNEERLGRTISNALSNQTLAGGLGNDSIYNTGNNVTIKSSEGADSITNRGANVLIEGNADSDNIVNSKFIEWDSGAYQWVTSSISPDNVTILGGEDSDRIFNYGGQRISIDGNAGNDYIENKREPYVYKDERPPGPDDEDYEEIVYPSPDYATLLGGYGNDTIINSGYHSMIDGGEGKDNIENYGDYSTINAGIGDDNVYNGSGDNALINGDDGSDYIRNCGENSTVNGGQGSDTLQNNSNSYSGGYSNVLLNGDEGDDFLRNRISLNISINGGTGNDTIENYGGLNVLLNGGEGDDLISNKTGYTGYDSILSDNVTIDAGTGNDTITNEGNNVLFKYSGGNDLITGFKSNSTLQIGDGTGTYSAETLNGDINLTVGENKITLSGAANLTTLNIEGKETSEEPEWSISENTASYGTNSKIYLTLSGLNPNVKISDLSFNENTNVITLSGGALGKDKVELVAEVDTPYKLALADDVTTPETLKAAQYDSSSMTYRTKGTTAGYKLDDKTISYVEGTSKEFKFEGVAPGATASSFYLSTAKKQLAIGKAAIQTDGTPIKLLTDGYTLRLGNNMTAPETLKAAQYDSSSMTYRTKGTTAGYKLDDKTISYVEGTSKEFKFEGVAPGATASSFYLSTAKKQLAIGKAAIQTDGTPIKLLTDGYTLRLGNNMTAPETLKAAQYDSSSMTYRTKGTTAGYKLDDKTISYVEGTSKEFKFEGVAPGATASSFYLSTAKKQLAIGKAAIQTDGTPIKLLTDGYTLRLGNNMTAPETATAFEYGNYTVEYSSEGYELAGKKNSIRYVKSGDVLLELSGVKKEPKAPADKVLSLEVADFDENIAVMSNSGKYIFSITKGDYTGKTFTGSSEADTITSAGSGIKINGGRGDDSLWGGGEAETFIYQANEGTDTIANYNYDDGDILQILKADGTAGGTFTDSSFQNGTLTLAISGGGSVILEGQSADDKININGTIHTISGKTLK